MVWITGSSVYGVAHSGKSSRTNVDVLALFANPAGHAGLRLSTQLRGSVSRGTETLGKTGLLPSMMKGYPIYLEKGRVGTAIASTRHTSNLRRNNGY